MNAYSERIFVLSLLSCVFSRTFLSGGIGAPIFSAFSRILPRVYLKSRNYRLFLQAQPDYALKILGQYRIILSAAAAGAVLKPSGGNCAVLP